MLSKDSVTGQFTLKGEEPRSVRSIRLTDSCWENLGEIAISKNMTRADYLESLNGGGNFEAIEQEIDASTIVDLLNNFLEDIYEDNSYEVVTRDKATVKRLMPILIEFFRDNL